MEKNILKEYTVKVREINSAFKNLIDTKLLPITHGDVSYTLESAKEVQDNLKNQEFTISVCGQINAGKSSFLNYLLFNDQEVLPADDTPWTAKLTTVRFGTENYATVVYYNTEEWAKLKSQEITNEDGESKTYYDEFLKEDVNKAALEGLNVETYITDKNKSVDGVSLKDLSNYVTKGGRLTPFVKQVDIKVNNELAKGVVFVDTPGINDRNELRSKVTEDWIKKSCAVIYLFYTGQALSTADYEFIDQHLSSIPTSKIVFALTKADVSDDYEGAKSFVEKTLKEDEELKKRKFITEEKAVFPISTLAALIKYKKSKNISLNEDEEFHLDRIQEECPSFIDNNGFIDVFVDGLKSHLMSQTGNAILDKSNAFLEAIYKTNIDALSSDLSAAKNKLSSLSLSLEELNSKRKELDDLLDNIEKFKIDFKRGKEEETVSNLLAKLEIELREFREKGCSNLKNELEDASTDYVSALRNLAPHKTRQALVDLSNDIHNSMLNELSVREEINGLLESFSNKFSSVIKDCIVYDGTLTCKVNNTADLVENTDYDELSVENLKETCGKAHILNKNKVKADIFSLITKVFETEVRRITKNVKVNVKNVIETNMNSVYNNVNTEITKLKENIDELKQTNRSQDEQKNEYQKEIICVQERLDFVNNEFKKLKK